MDLPEETGIDPLTHLEERIQKAVDLIARLREANHSAEAERDAAVREASQWRTKFEELSAEVETLRRERDQVRSRIQKLLGHLDVLGQS